MEHVAGVSIILDTWGNVSIILGNDFFCFLRVLEGEEPTRQNNSGNSPLFLDTLTWLWTICAIVKRDRHQVGKLEVPCSRET